MRRVTGIGGVFFRAQDPKGLRTWYQQHLGIHPSADGTVIFEWRERGDPERVGMTVWAPFPQNTTYFGPDGAAFMINYRVDDLNSLLAQLRAEGVQVDDRIEESEFGRFRWITDVEGNRVELWEPPEGQ